MHNILDEFEFGPDWTTCYRVICLESHKIHPYTYNEENSVSDSFYTSR